MVRQAFHLHKDKIMHFIAMTVITAFLAIVFGIPIAIVVGAVLSVAKEIYDKMFKDEEIDKGDLAADGAGIVFGLLLAVFLKL